MKKIFLACSLFLCSFSNNVFSSHFMGGEITWECITAGPNIGQYIFTMKVYRDCDGITFSQTAQTLTHHNYPALGMTSPILLNFISITDISPVGTPGSGNTCFTCAAGNLGAVEEYIWRSDPTTLAGTPPAEGWHFTWGSCCRSSSITNGMADDPWTLRAVMYPYTDPVTGTVLPADPCYDSSPEFKELAKTIICTGYEFSYSHNASDEELDAITYSWGTPLGENLNYNPSIPNSTALVFSAPYSVNSPIPGAPTLDATTGEITYTSMTSGIFVTCIKVEAFKCGQLVAEVYREVQVVLVDCSLYNPPTDGFNDPPVISEAFTDPITGLPSYETTVYAGDLITFNIDAQDFDTYGGGVLQNVTLDVSGGQFADDFINVNLCDNPPCATFNNGAGITPPFSAPGVVSGVFEWQTDCAHMEADVGCSATSNIFTFLVKAYDDFCPANGIAIATIKITVVPPIPDFRCVYVQENGDIDLTWKFVDGAPPTSEPYMIYHSTSQNGPYTLIDSIYHPTTTYTHVGANGNSASQYYFLSTEEACGVMSSTLESDTLQSIFMDVNPINLGVMAGLSWNPIIDPLLPTSYLDYDLYLRKNTNTSFINILTTPLLTHFYDAEFCDYYPEFYVEIDDISGCTSKSSIGVVNLLDTITPVTPVITDVSVNNSGKSVISWTSSPGTDFYAIYKKDQFGAWVTIDSIFGVNNTTYTYANSDASNILELFTVRALDSCGNNSATTSEHNSMNLEAVLNACDHTLAMDWNDYINWNGGTHHYEVVINETTCGIDPRTTIRLEGDATELLLQDIIHSCTYDIYILAYNQDSTYIAMSDQISFYADLPKRPDFNYITTSSVDHFDGSVDIFCHIDNTAIISRYEIDRSLREENNFTNIGSIPFPSSGDMIYYNDVDVETEDHFYQYHIFPVDTCNERVSPPTIVGGEDEISLSQTILSQTAINTEYGYSIFPPDLQSQEPSQNYHNTIHFNEYIDWLGGVDHYKLYRSINREPFETERIAEFDNNGRLTLSTYDGYPYHLTDDTSFVYVDVVDEYQDGNGRFCYYIEAVEGGGNNYSLSETSVSNVSCVSQTPKLLTPNTFTPDGQGPAQNELFKPVTAFVSEEGYSFSVYSRNGQKIFHTNLPSKGWDGNYNGVNAPNGNYVYYVQYINGIGNLTRKTDIITLLR